MHIDDLKDLGATITLTVKQADLKEFANQVASQAIEGYRREVSAQSEERLLTIKQVSELLSVDKSTLYRWEKAEYLRPRKIGGLVRYVKSDVDEIIGIRNAKTERKAV